MNVTSLPEKTTASLPSRNRLRHIDPLSVESSSSSSSTVGPFPTPSPSSVTSGSESSQSSQNHQQGHVGSNSNNSNSSMVELQAGCGSLQSSSSNPPPLITSQDFNTMEHARTNLSLQNTSKLCHVGPSMPDPPQLIPYMKAECELGEQQQIPIFSFDQDGKPNLIKMAMAHPPWLSPISPIPPGHLAGVCRYIIYILYICM